MLVTRRFHIAPSLTRLIRKECGFEPVIEGHFAPQADRQSHVRIEKGRSRLVLTSLDTGPEVDEDRTDLPNSHAASLLEVCPGKVTFGRSVLCLDGYVAHVDRFVCPGSLDLVSVEFTTQAEASAFVAPVWFGGEVTQDDKYLNRSIALFGSPNIADTQVSNDALEAVLDILESHLGTAADEQASRNAPLGSSNLLQRVPVVELMQANATASDALPFKRSRPVMQMNSRDNDGDERLAAVIEGLSDTLAESAIEKESRPATDVEPRKGWRRSAH